MFLSSTVTSFTFAVSGSDIREQVNIANGTVLPTTFQFNNTGLHTNNDRIQVVGAAGQTAQYTPDSTTTGNGSIVVLGTSTGTATFSGLNGVDLTGFDTATLLTPNADDTLSLLNGTSFYDGTTKAVQISGMSGPVDIALAVWGNTSVVVDAATNHGTDSVTINGASDSNGPVLALDDLTINTNTGGTNSVAIDGAVNISGDLSVTSDAISSTSGGTIQTGGALSLNGDTIDIGGTIQTGGLVSLDAGNEIDIGADITAVGSVTLEANQDGTGIQGFTQESSTTIQGASIDICVNTGSNGAGGATLDQIVATSGTIEVCTLGDPTSTGSILGQATNSLNAMGGTALMTDAGSIGLGSQAINFVDGQTVSVQTFGGKVFLDGAGILTVSQADTSGVGTDVAGGDVTVNAVGTLSITNSGINTSGGTSPAGVGQNGGNVVLTGSSVDTVAITTDGGAGTGSGSAGGNAGTIDITASGSITLNGDLHASGGDAGSGADTAGSGGAVTLHRAVTLGNGVTTITTAPGTVGTAGTGGAVDFKGSVDATTAGVQGLTVQAGSGTVTFEHAVGNTSAALANLGVTAGTIDLNGGAIKTSGAQGYNGAVIVGADLDLTTGTTVTFGGTVDDATANAHSLTVHGAAVFNGVVGGAAGVTALKSLHVTGSTTFNLGATAVSTSTTQDYDASVIVGDNLDLTGTTVTFGGTVDDATAGTHSLTVNGAAVFKGVVGGAAGVTALKSLDVTGITNFNLGATAVSTSTTQDYESGVVIGDNLNLKGTTVTFGGTVDDAASGSHDLKVTGAAVFDGIVGATHLHSLEVTLGSTFNASATAVTTTRTQNYDGAVTLKAALTTFAAQGITFGDILNGNSAYAQDLTIDAGSGNLKFTGAVGGIDALGAIDIANADDVTESAGIIATSLTQDAGIGTTKLNGLVSTSSGVSLTTSNINVASGGITNAAGGVLLVGDTMTIGATIDASAGSQTVTLREKTAGTAISLGTTGGLTLQQSDLSNVKASILEIGDASAASITFGAAINVSSANVPTVRLITGGSITGQGLSGTPDITAQTLVLYADGGVGSATIPFNTLVGTLQVTDLGPSNTVAIANTGALVLADVDTRTYAVSNVHGDITISTTGTLNVTADVTAPNGNVQLSAGTTFTMTDTVLHTTKVQSGGGAGNFIVITSASGSNTLANLSAARPGMCCCKWAAP